MLLGSDLIYLTSDIDLLTAEVFRPLQDTVVLTTQCDVKDHFVCQFYCTCRRISLWELCEALCT